MSLSSAGNWHWSRIHALLLILDFLTTNLESIDLLHVESVLIDSYFLMWDQKYLTCTRALWNKTTSYFCMWFIKMALQFTNGGQAFIMNDDLSESVMELGLRGRMGSALILYIVVFSNFLHTSIWKEIQPNYILLIVNIHKLSLKNK